MTVTGIATPSLDARLMNRLGLRPDVKRTPIFGLGCVAGAAGTARATDVLRAYPDQVAVMLSVELCSLTLQREDVSIPNIIASGLFGDGAAAVVLAGAERVPAHRAPRIVATRSVFYPDTERIMGWDVVEGGFKVVLSAKVPTLVTEHVGEDVDGFLGAHGLHRSDIRHWIAHTGGPKVLQAFESALELPPEALRRSWDSLRKTGNLSSASVLFVLGRSPGLGRRPAGRPRTADGDGAGLLRRAGAAPMVTSVQAYLALLVLVALERGVELVLSARNARTARTRGGVESGQGHYPVMATFHALFLVACAAEVVFLHRPFPGLAGLGGAGGRGPRPGPALLGHRHPRLAVEHPHRGGTRRAPGHRAARTAGCGIPTTWRWSPRWWPCRWSTGPGSPRGSSRWATPGSSGSGSAPRSARSAPPGRRPSPAGLASSPGAPVATDAEVLQFIRALARSELEISRPIGPDDDLLKDLALDSLSLTVLAVGLENRFRVKLTEADAEGVRTVGDLARHVALRTTEVVQ